jgi:hypothetical protein
MKEPATVIKLPSVSAPEPALFPFDGTAILGMDIQGARARGAGTYWWLALGIVCAILLFPMFLTDVPPLLDYPNHLARLMVLADNGVDPILRRFFQPNWGIIPDLGIDLIGTPLVSVLPIHVAGRIVLSIALLLPVLGTVAYSRAVFGRLTWWSLGCALVAYNATYTQGFLNFMMGTGLALLLAAAWIAWRDSAPWRTLAIAIPGAVALFFCHLMGLLFYALLIGSSELAGLPALLRSLRRLAARVGFAASIFVVPLMLYLSSELNAMADETVYLPLGKKLAQLLEPFANYYLPLDIATAVLIAGGLTLAAATRHLRMPARSTIALVLVALIYAVAPSEYKHTSNLDMRFVVYFGFLMFGAVAPVGLGRRNSSFIMAGIAALFVGRMAIVSDVWLGHNQDLEQLRSVMAHIEPGSLVYVTDVKPEESPAYWDNGPRARRLSNGLRMDPHWPALVLIERRAWWPFLFANPSQQPILNRPVYQAMADGITHLPALGELEGSDDFGLCGFDTVLLMMAGGEPDLEHYSSERLTLIDGNDTAALFRIKADPTCVPPKR